MCEYLREYLREYLAEYIDFDDSGMCTQSMATADDQGTVLKFSSIGYLYPYLNIASMLVFYIILSIVSSETLAAQPTISSLIRESQTEKTLLLTPCLITTAFVSLIS